MLELVNSVRLRTDVLMRSMDSRLEGGCYSVPQSERREPGLVLGARRHGAAMPLLQGLRCCRLVFQRSPELWAVMDKATISPGMLSIRCADRMVKVMHPAVSVVIGGWSR